MILAKHFFSKEDLSKAIATAYSDRMIYKDLSLVSIMADVAYDELVLRTAEEDDTRVTLTRKLFYEINVLIDNEIMINADVLSNMTDIGLSIQ